MACAPSTPRVEYPREDTAEVEAPAEDPMAGPPSSQKVDAPAPWTQGATETLPAGTDGKVMRTTLLRVLDAGPARFLQSVEVRPSLHGQRFQGWEIVAFRAPDLMLAGLLPGDVIVAVNDAKIERPEELHAAWEALRKAQELTVDYRRMGKVRRLRYAIVP